MKAAQSKIGKKLFSNEKTGREILKRLRDAGKSNPDSAASVSIRTKEGKVLVLKER